MQRLTLLLASLALVVLAAPAAADWNRQFNWLPSGHIDVGDPDSEVAGRYEADGKIVARRLSYRNESNQKVTARRVLDEERFVLTPASWRGGAAPAHLVLCKTVDTDDLPSTIEVIVNDEPHGVWNIVPPEGPRRLYDALYVIPRSIFPDGQPPAEVTVRLKYGADAGVYDKEEKGVRPIGGRIETAHASIGYRFYATRDWDVLGAPLAGDVRAAAEKANGPAAAYLRGLIAMNDHDYGRATRSFEKTLRLAQANADASELARLARWQARAALLRETRRRIAAREHRPDFKTHYELGLLAGAWGCWEDARAEFGRAARLEPKHADATYRLAEAMEYCRQPVDQWAPLMQRAGELGAGPHTNVERVLLAIHKPKVDGICGDLSSEELERIKRDWHHVEQQLFGASLGAWKLDTEIYLADESDPDWVMQAGWIFLPPDKIADYEGQYQYSIGSASFGWSHAGGADCGVAGAGGANIGANRGWEVFMHEWNHQFDWVSIFAESCPGYPVTHDSDGCGKQPIVNMGCGHRSSMRYYLTPAQWRRHRTSDKVNPAAFVADWTLGPLVAVADKAAPTADKLADWLVEQEHFAQADIDRLRRDWESQKKREKARAEKPPTVPPYPAPPPVPDWHGFLRERWNEKKMIDAVAGPDEADFVAGNAATTHGAIRGTANFMDLREHTPAPPVKCVQYARTFVYAPQTQEVRLWLGYNDCGRLWLNGRPLTTGHYYACAKWDDANRPYMLAVPGELRRGWNCLAVKIERGGGDWGFSLHIVDFDNNTIDGLKFSTTLPDGAACNTYQPPEVGPHYRWADVRDDYLEKLPRLDDAALARLTGIDGLQCHEHRFLLTLPAGRDALPGSHYIDAVDDDDRTLNNYLNWDYEAAGALRYRKDGEVRDLVFVRPEYYAEFMALLAERDGARREKTPDERILGYLWLDDASYKSTPNRPATRRAVLVIDARLGDYPLDDLDLLAPL